MITGRRDDFSQIPKETFTSKPCPSDAGFRKEQTGGQKYHKAFVSM